jgi:prepilin-type N-terminal cleavage/methylation domain-containing protein
MKRVLWNNKKEKGFTLLEVIVTIIVAAVIGSMLIPLMGTALKHSADPVNYVKDELELNKVIENITADYKNLLNGSNPLTTLETEVGPEDSDQNNDYGQYHVVENHRITFTGTPLTEQPDASKKIQKITISYKGYTLTSLFTE